MKPLLKAKLECLDCGNKFKKLSKTDRCTNCGLIHTKLQNDKSKLLLKWFAPYSMEETMRILSFLDESKKFMRF